MKYTSFPLFPPDRLYVLRQILPYFLKCSAEIHLNTLLISINHFLPFSNLLLSKYFLKYPILCVHNLFTYLSKNLHYFNMVSSQVCLILNLSKDREYTIYNTDHWLIVSYYIRINFFIIHAGHCVMRWPGILPVCGPFHPPAHNDIQNTQSSLLRLAFSSHFPE